MSSNQQTPYLQEPFRIAVDTGGTFTDVVLADRVGTIALGKALTTPQRAFEGIGAGLSRLAEEHHLTLAEALAGADTFIYGTTRSTNAVVEKTTATTALFTTAGLPDVLVLKEGGKPHPFRQMHYPDPYIPRRLTWEIDERIDVDGSVFRPLQESSVRHAIQQARQAGCQAIAVCLIWSVVNPAHELAIERLIREEWPEVAYTLSHQVNPVVREYRRASSAALDASLKPLMQEHLTTLAHDLTEEGFGGHLLVASSYGGTWPVQDMVQRPIYSIGSGPSLAPVAARSYAQAEAVSAASAALGSGGSADAWTTASDLLVCDTGGTTFDVGIVSAGHIAYTGETWLGGRWIGAITGTRAVDVTSIGSGGGSIVWLDSGGLLRVGPRSAGSEPGPASYGRGGTQPTITDACVVLGYLDPDSFLGGRMKLDEAAARDAFAAHIAPALNMMVEQAAWAALVVAVEDLVGAVRTKTVSQGLDPRDMLIVAGGGASGLTIGRIAEELGTPRVLIPRVAGALSACGGIHSDIVCEFSVPGFAHTDDFNHEIVNGWLWDARSQGQQFLDSLKNLPIESSDLTFSVETRYRLQAWELEVPLTTTDFSTPGAVEELQRAFDVVHDRMFSVSEPGQRLECLVWKCRATARLPKPSIDAGPRPDTAEPARTRPAFFASHRHDDVAHHDGTTLPLGAQVKGPAVVREPTTTIVVYPGQSLTVTTSGNYLLQTGK